MNIEKGMSKYLSKMVNSLKMNYLSIVKKVLLFIICCFLFTFNSTAQITFTASTDSKQVPVGEVFEVKFTLQNAQGQGFRPPTLGDFSVVGGPNRMNSTTIINGNAMSSESYSYVLQSKKEGVFTIGSASISAKGQTLKTFPLSINVIKGKKQTLSEMKGDSKDGVIIRAEPSSHEGYVGQQIIVDYKLYTRLNLNGMNLLNEPKYDDFFYLEVNDYQHGDNRVTLGGKEYMTRILRRVALFPKKEGTIEVEPMNVQVGIVSSGGSNPFEDPFFGNVRSENKTIASNSIDFQIKSLPNNAPPSFSGAVGSFQIETSISKTEGTTDDALSLKMRVTGNGDAKRWLAPKLTPVEGLDIYEPKTLGEGSVEANGEWQTTKEFEFLIIPKRKGNFTIKPEFSYFDTEGGDYKTLMPNTFDLKIAQGKNATASLAGDKIKDILPNKTKTAFVNQITFFHGSTLFWALATIPFLFVGGVLGYKQILIQRSKVDVNVLKSQNAQKVSEGRLRVAYDFLKKDNKRMFYDEVSKAMFTYLSDKIGIPMSEFSKSNAEEKLKSLNVNDLNIQNFMRILNKCEIALFAGQNTEGGMEADYQDSLKVITAIENDLKNKDDWKGDIKKL
jgi:BatD DUF11 like domain